MRIIRRVSAVLIGFVFFLEFVEKIVPEIGGGALTVHSTEERLTDRKSVV